MPFNPKAFDDDRHLSAPDRSRVTERKVVFLNALEHWVTERRVEEHLSAEQLGNLDGLARLQSQRQSLLDNVAHFYAKNKNADAAPGVLLLVTFFSDNNRGYSSLSVRRLAQFLSRSERRISDAIARLERDQLVIVKAVPGSTSCVSPWVHKSFGSTKDPLAWLLDLRAPSSHRQAPGRPRKTPDATVIPIFGCNDANAPTPPTSAAITPDVRDEAPDAGGRTPPTQASPNTTKLNTAIQNTTESASHSRSNSKSEGRVSCQAVAIGSDGFTEAREAIAAYNRGAERHGWEPCLVPTKSRLRRMAERLDEIGGVPNFCLALAQVPNDDFLSGRIMPREGFGFQLNIDRLLSTSSGMGDVLAQLLDRALDEAATKGTRNTKAESDDDDWLERL